MTLNLSDWMGEEESSVDLQAERSVLGAVFLDPEALDVIRSILEPRDFSQERNELIYKVMLYLDELNIPVDLVTVTNHYTSRNRMGDMGGVKYLTDLASSVPTAANVAYYARIVRSKAHRRRGVELGAVIARIAQEGEFEDDEAYFAAIEDAVTEIRPQETGKMQSLAEIRERYFQHLKSKAEKLLTGFFPQFDEWAQLWRGWLYIIAGRPSVGKTAKALLLLLGIAKNNPNAGAILFYSQEMETEEVIDRMVAAEAEVNYPRLINKGGPEGFTDAEWEKINKAYAAIEKYPIYIQDSAGVTIDQIRAEVKKMKKKHKRIAAVIVDYLQIMEIPTRRGELRTQAIGRVTKAAKTMARRMKFVFIMLSQLDRDADNEEPKLRHLKESGSIEQDADVVEFLWYNPESNREPGKKIIDSIFAKGRNIGLNRFRLEFKWWFQKYVELEKPRPKEKKPMKEV